MLNSSDSLKLPSVYVWTERQRRSEPWEGAPGQYRILFATCSCKVVDRKERKKLIINHRKKRQYYKAMAPPKKIYFWRENNLGI